MEWGQEAIRKALDFGGRNRLEFGAEKTEAIIFTHKQLKVGSLPHLHMGTRDLDYSDMVKYLGILLSSLPLAHISGKKQKNAIRLISI